MSANSGRVGHPVPITAEVVAGRDTDGNVFVLSFDADGNLKVSSSGGGGGAVTIADGADVAEGSTTDTAKGDADGTVNAHARFIAKAQADVTDFVNHWVKVSIQNAALPPVLVSNVFALPTCQYVGQVATSSTVDTFTGRLVDASGSIVWVVVITYSDSTKSVMLSAARTT